MNDQTRETGLSGYVSSDNFVLIDMFADDLAIMSNNENAERLVCITEDNAIKLHNFEISANLHSLKFTHLLEFGCSTLVKCK